MSKKLSKRESKGMIRGERLYLLHQHAENGDVDGVKSLLKKRYPVNELDAKHWTPLHCAASARQLEVCKLLLKRTADPRAVTSNNATALHYICRIQHDPLLVPVLQILVESGADVNHANYQQNTPLHEAALRGSVASARFLLENGANINAINRFGETALHNAVRSQSEEMIRCLATSGIDVSVTGENGTALDVVERELHGETADAIRRILEDLQSGAAPSERVPFDYASLSDEAKQIIDEAEIDPSMVNQHFQSSRIILHFCHKKLGHLDLSQPVFSTGDPHEVYKLGEVEAKGGFGTVTMAVHNKLKEKVAIKILDHDTKKQIKKNTIEVRALRSCQHKNIVTLRDAYVLSDEKKCWMVMEYLKGGSVKQILKKKTRLSIQHIAYITKEILEGLAVVHARNIIHRDIKCDNVAMSVQGDVKLLDFGCAYDLTRGGKLNIVGTAAWMSPEVIKRECHTTKIDIWGVGICVLEMLNGEPPLFENKVQAMFHTLSGKGYDRFLDERLPTTLQHFVKVCLQYNPEDRPSAAELLRHKFFHLVCSRKGVQDLVSAVFLEKNFEHLSLV